MRKKISLKVHFFLIILLQVSDSYAARKNASGIYRSSRTKTTDTLRISSIECGESASLAAGESTLIFSNNDGGREICNWQIDGPAGSTLKVSCPNVAFSPKGCKKEQLTLIDGSDETPYCRNENPDGFESSGNSLQIKYSRNLRAKDCSGGFLCQVTVM